ncbi:Rpn family recombination-promoting nuclease/putative transposase [Pontibacter qinzhouensis]|nr:Rpn family recombination-promoting nuclease/putative transposase [Pontibacter qinzhouensis]
MEIKGKYINPFTDFGFKKLFGSEFNKELLIDFLNQVLGDREQVQDLTYLNPEQLGNLPEDRKAIYDLYCENERGEKFIIELQHVRQEFFKDRSIFYATFPVQSQAPKGKAWDYRLKAVYTIGILNFSFHDLSEQDRFVREVQLLDTKTGEVFYDKLTFIYLEVPRFKKQEEELETHFDKWMFVLKNLHRFQERPRKLQERVFTKLFAEAEIAKLNAEDMRTYQESLKVYRDNQNTFDYSIKEAKRKGREEGREEGWNEGHHAAQLEIAKQLKARGIALVVIAEATGLPEEELEKL